MGDKERMSRGKRLLRIITAVLLIAAGYIGMRAGYYAHQARKQAELDILSTLTITYVIEPSDRRWQAARFSNDFDVTALNGLVVRNGDHLFEVPQPFGQGVVMPVKINGPAPESFAIDDDGTLLTIAGGYFGMLGEDGKTVDAVPLPKGEMHLAHSEAQGVIYLYGGENSDYRLYSFSENGSFRILLQTENPITAVADNTNSIYVVTGDKILRIHDNQITPMLRINESDLGGPILSVVPASADDVVFFSTSRQVFALYGGAAVSIINNSGGALRLRQECLYVLDPERSMLYAVSPATRELFREKKL